MRGFNPSDLITHQQRMRKRQKQGKQKHTLSFKITNSNQTKHILIKQDHK